MKFFYFLSPFPPPLTLTGVGCLWSFHFKPIRKRVEIEFQPIRLHSANNLKFLSLSLVFVVNIIQKVNFCVIFFHSLIDFFSVACYFFELGTQFYASFFHTCMDEILWSFYNLNVEIFASKQLNAKSFTTKEKFFERFILIISWFDEKCETLYAKLKERLA